MNKQEILKQYSKEEDKILVAKILDKIQYTSQKNQIQTTDFLDGYQQKMAQKILQQVRYQEGIFYGGYEEAERKMLFLFPEKLFVLLKSTLQEDKMIQKEMKAITIKLPNDLKGKYSHRDYLSGIMKLGIKREKIGDILVREDGADILVQEEMLTYLLSNLPQLTRFQKSEILSKEISELEVVPIQLEEITILVPQLRLDVIISELVHTSRTRANEIILQERVLVNYEIKTKNATMLQVGDLLTIRGKGKFKIGEVISQTSKGKLRVEVEKYVS
ncbi:MAG: hypothetical protein HFJ32_04695 [Clostridia bacterium]|nr:hypothetical protein [Clostridia bacterium]